VKLEGMGALISCNDPENLMLGCASFQKKICGCSLERPPNYVGEEFPRDIRNFSSGWQEEGQGCIIQDVRIDSRFRFSSPANLIKIVPLGGKEGYIYHLTGIWQSDIQS